MSFANQQPFTVTEKDTHLDWGCGKNGKYFRCGMCGHKFAPGDVCRWVYMNSTPESRHGNFMTCATCDGPDIRDRRIEWEKEASTRFWQLTRGDPQANTTPPASGEEDGR